MSLFSAIYEETGPGTTAEIRRLRKRLQYLEAYKDSLLQSLMRTGTAEGPEGSKNVFLRLDCSNDPLTGDLDLDGSLDVEDEVTITGYLYVAPASLPTGVPAVEVNAPAAGAGALQPNDATLVSNLQWWWRGDEESSRTDGESVTSFDTHADSQSDTTFTRVAGTFNYRATTGPNSTPWLESSSFGRFSAGANLSIAGGYTVIAVWRSSDGTDDSTNPLFGEASAATKKGIYTPGTSSTNSWDQYSFYDEGLSTWVQCSNSVEGGDPAVNTWFVGVWRKNASDEMECFHASEATPLYDASLASPPVREENLDLDLMFGDRDGGTQQCNNGFGVAEFMIYDATLTNGQLNQLYTYLVDRYAFASATASDEDVLQIKVNDATTLVVDETGSALHLGGSDPQFTLDVEGTADISGALTAGSASVSGALSVTGDSQLTTLGVSGLSTFTGTISLDSTNPIQLGAGQEAAIAYDGTRLSIDPGASTTRFAQGDVEIAADSTALVLGAGQDATLEYDGTDVQLDAKAVGSGDFNVNASALRLSDTQADTTNKVIRFQSQPYNLANNPVTLIQMTNTAGASSCNWGGGSSIETAVTSHNFYTAGSVGTNQGTKQWAVLANGNLRNEAANALDCQTGEIWQDDNADHYFGTALDARIYYDGTNLICSPREVGSGDLILSGNASLEIQSTGVLKGDRHSFICAGTVTADGYLTIGGTTAQASLGYLMPRAGSIISYGISNYEVVTTANDNMQFQIRKNNTAVWNATIYSTVTSAYATQARAVDTFAAGDILHVYVDVAAGYNATRNVIMNIEVIYDD